MGQTDKVSKTELRLLKHDQQQIRRAVRDIIFDCLVFGMDPINSLNKLFGAVVKC